mmetsp:Transcript_16106/g.62820  ORF Transcript_16106/g.62820 Transcript_16106/m.62820 type:complete len:210 (+) Transcript_16106:1077-1706(+)
MPVEDLDLLVLLLHLPARNHQLLVPLDEGVLEGDEAGHVLVFVELLAGVERLDGDPLRLLELHVAGGGGDGEVLEGEVVQLLVILLEHREDILERGVPLDGRENASAAHARELRGGSPRRPRLHLRLRCLLLHRRHRLLLRLRRALEPRHLELLAGALQLDVLEAGDPEPHFVLGGGHEVVDHGLSARVRLRNGRNRGGGRRGRVSSCE